MPGGHAVAEAGQHRSQIARPEGTRHIQVNPQRRHCRLHLGALAVGPLRAGLLQLPDKRPPPHIEAALSLLGVLRQNGGVAFRLRPRAFLERAVCLHANRPPSFILSDVDFRFAAQGRRQQAVAALKRPFPLRLQGTVINPLKDTSALQRQVLVFGPDRPPFRQQLVAIPLAGLDRP